MGRVLVRRLRTAPKLQLRLSFLNKGLVDPNRMPTEPGSGRLKGPDHGKDSPGILRIAQEMKDPHQAIPSLRAPGGPGRRTGRQLSGFAGNHIENF